MNYPYLCIRIFKKIYHMKKFKTLKIHQSQECLTELLNTLRLSKKTSYTYQKKLTEDYAKNIFVDVNKVACFKTKRKSLFESCVWLLVSSDTLIVTNITSSINHQLGITNYNFILMSFFNDFISPYLDDTFQVEISGEEISLQEMLNEETFKFLNIWERTCNKETPVSHPIDYQNWMNFVVSAYKHKCELSPDDLSQWLSEDKHWPQMFNKQISEIVSLYEYGIDILETAYDEDR